MRDDTTVEAGSGNVFEDLGFANPQERLAKSMMSRLIEKDIASRGLTQQHAASLLGCSQPDISKIVRGRVNGFSIERLAKFLTLLGHNVEIRISEAKDQEEGELVVAGGLALD